MSPVSDSYIGISGYIIFWVLFAVALGFFIQRVVLLARLLKLGRPEDRFDHPARRVSKTLALFFSQATNLRSFTFRDPAALGHSIMLWGLIIFAFGYFVYYGLAGGFGLFSAVNGTGFDSGLSSVLDIVALLVILAVLWIVVKRYILVPERLKREMDTYEKIVQPLLIVVIFALMLLHFAVDGFRYAAYGIPDGPPLSVPLADTIVSSGLSTDTAAVIFEWLWWLNYVLLLVAVVYAPRSRHLHPLTSFANLFFANNAPKGSLKTVDLTHAETAGVSKIRDFTWKQLLDLYSCTWCGRCHVVCPAQVSGKPLSPREMVLGLKDHLLREGPGMLKAAAIPAQLIPAAADDTANKPEPATEGEKTPGSKLPANPLIGSAISEDALWSCTTCRACQEVCPVNVEHIDKIVGMRRHLQMVAMTEVARDPLKNLRVRGNPYRGAIYARTDWTEGLDIKIVGEDSNIDILFWVGCTEALEDRSLKVARAIAGILKQAGVNFGILGEEEMCCGDPARRLGAEHIYQMLAASNIQLLQSYNIKKIVTACPHCFNIFKNEYPQLGGQFEVVHHTRFIAGLIREGKLKIRPENISVTYQEPCYLGRYNDIYEEPRRIIGKMGMHLAEMAQTGKNGFCCGGGGGRMWLEEKTGRRINEIRLDQAIATQAKVVATACPYCLQMFEDAAKEKEVQETLKIQDLAELLVEHLEEPAIQQEINLKT